MFNEKNVKTMFGVIKNMSSIVCIVSTSNHRKCVLLSNQKCLTQLILNNSQYIFKQASVA